MKAKLCIALVAVSAAALAALAAGCGGGGGGGTDETEQPNPQGRTAGVLRIPGPDPLTIDPALTGDAGSAVYVEEIFGGLLTLVPGDNDQVLTLSDGTTAVLKDVNLSPDIAEAIPEPEFNADGTVSYTFKIRQDVYFHRGRQVTAWDFVYSWERAADPRTTSSTAELYLGDILGVMDMQREKLINRVAKRGQAELLDLPGLEVIDDFTLRVTIDAAKPYFLWKLTYPTSFVVDREQVESNPRNWTRFPNGTGPFILTQWIVGQEIVLERNPRYHLGAAKLTRAVFNLSGGSVLTMYTNGDVDVSGVPLPDIDRVRDPKNPINRELAESADLSTFYIAFNVEKPPFDDVKVRQAFAKALDMDTVIKTVLKNAVVAARSIVPPGMEGYEPPTDAALTYNPEEARRLLASSSYAGNMPRIVLSVSGGGSATAGPLIDYIVEAWRQELGVAVEIRQSEYGAFLEDLKRGKFQMFSLGWIADYPDPEDFLDLKFYSGRSVANNETRYANADVDALLEQARVEQDPVKRAALYQQAERIILQDAPWIPLYHGKNIVLVKPYVTGYEPQPFAIPHLRFVDVAPPAPESAK